MRLHFDVLGDRNSPVIALIHGIMSSNRQWTPNVAALAEHFRVVMIELWGHGRSPTPEDDDAYGVDGLVRAIDDVRQRVEVSRWGLVGHSFGGAVALKYALARPARTTALVFSNSRAALSASDPTSAARGADALARVGSLRDLPQHPIHTKHYPAPLKGELVADADSTSPIALAKIVRQSWQLSSRHDVGDLRVPTTLINGVRERGFQPDVAHVRSLNPEITIIELNGGHSINIEAPEQFNAAVIDILGRAAAHDQATRGS